MTCSVPWCETTHPAALRPDQRMIHHERVLGRFVNGDIVIRVGVAAGEFLSTGEVSAPEVFVRRGPERYETEITPADIDQFAPILGGLDPAHLLAFATSLAKAVDFARHCPAEDQ